MILDPPGYPGTFEERRKGRLGMERDWKRWYGYNKECHQPPEVERDRNMVLL